MQGKRGLPERPRSPQTCTSFKVKHIRDKELIETAACLPFCTATKGLTWRQVFTLRFPLALELVRLTTTAAMEAPGLDRANSFSPQKHSYSVYRPVKRREWQALSMQRERCLQNGKARLVPAGPLFQGHTQHAPLWLLRSPRRHRLPCVSFPDSTSRSRVFCIMRTASTKERRKLLLWACGYSKACSATGRTGLQLQ